MRKQVHEGRSHLGRKLLDYELNQGATLLAVEKPSVGIENKEHDFRDLGLEFALEDMQPLSVADGDIARWYIFSLG